ncbi:hypothetical protein [Pseudomonas sp. MWU13-3659]|uniref:hypothetical protein n=1 Tax=Pseudomonas sp. MWU13-3659 TaxID=2986964 RepID=UPI00207620E1|nr:hypothetical protein [Pseudomonas sp. MWU13-3659]
MPVSLQSTRSVPAAYPTSMASPDPFGRALECYKQARPDGEAQAIEALQRHVKQAATQRDCQNVITLMQRHADQQPFIRDMLMVSVLAALPDHSAQSLLELEGAIMRLLDRFRADEFQAIKLESIDGRVCFTFPISSQQAIAIPASAVLQLKEATQCPSPRSELAQARLDMLHTDYMRFETASCLECLDLNGFTGCQLMELRAALYHTLVNCADSQADHPYEVRLREWPEPRNFKISGRTFDAIVELLPMAPRYSNAVSLEPFLGDRLKDIQQIRARQSRQEEVSATVVASAPSVKKPSTTGLPGK